MQYCRVLVNGGRVEYVTDEGRRSLYWNIPIANTTTVLLGTGTSVTQAAMRELAKAGVLVGFCGGGGTPLFNANEVDIEVAWFTPQSEYRPTEYLQRWVSFWFDTEKRLEAAKQFQYARLDFIKPGFEDKQMQLSSKNLADVLEQEEWEFIDARPRVVARENLQPKSSLVDLEHYQLQQKILPKKVQQSPRRRAASTLNQVPPLGAHSWWTAPYATFMTLLQQTQPFRDDKGMQRIDLVLLVNEGEDDYSLCQIVDKKRGALMAYVEIDESKLHRIPDVLVQGERVNVWIQEDYLTQVIAQAEAEEICVRCRVGS